MKKGNLWIFNYDFEYRLAKKGVIKVTNSQIIPWYFLNRNSLILAPLLKCDDAILVYEKPAATLLEQYAKHSVDLPELFEFTPETESNSALNDFQPILKNLTEKPALVCWGLTQQALGNNPPFLQFELIKKLNSKLFTAKLREQFLPPAWQIPNVRLTDKAITEQGLKNIIAEQIVKNGASLIKHAFGVSGRLIDQVGEGNISTHQLKRWLHWIKREGGLLIEKRLQIRQEWSLQLHFLKGGAFEVITLTRLFNSNDLSYSGTAINQEDQSLVPVLVKQLKPLLDYISSLNYRGPLGLDIIESEEAKFHLLEINTRYTMGRVSSAWHQKLGNHICSYFTCFFYRSCRSLEQIIGLVRDISLELKVKLFVVNHVFHPASNRSYITLYAGSNSTGQNMAAVKKLRVQLGMG